MSSATPQVSVGQRKRKRVALVYPFFAHYRGPLLQELLARSVHDYILVGDTKGEGGIETWPIPPGTEFKRVRLLRWGSLELFQLGVVSLSWKRDLDAIIYLGNAHWASTWLSAAMARLLGKKVYFWTHGWTSRKDPTWKNLLRRAFYSLANGLLLYGHFAKMVGIVQGFASERLHVIYNSLDYSRQREIAEKVSPQRLQELRIQLFGGAETPVVICSSRLAPVRRLDLLVEAIALLQDSGHRVNLLLVGDGPERTSLAKLAASKNVAVAFTGACYDESRLAELTLCANVTVAPGKIGLTAMQSLAFGTPVITHDDVDDQMPEWEAIQPGRTGSCFHKGDVADLAEQIKQWTSSAQTSPVVRTECVKIIERFYTPQFQRWAIDRAVGGYPADDLFWQRERQPRRDKAVVGYISNGMTPYGVHFLRRVASELDIDLRCFYTHQYSMGTWDLPSLPNLQVQHFGLGESAANANKPNHILAEWRKGGRIIEELKRSGAQGIVILGYNDLGRLRIIDWCYRHDVAVLLFGDSNYRCDRVSGWRRLFKNIVIPCVLAKCSRILACGSLGAEYFTSYGVPRENIHYSPYEPDYSLIEQLPEAVMDETATRFSIDRSRRHIIYSGRLAQVKRVDLLIRAFIQIAPTRPDWDLLIVGNGSLRNELGLLVPENLKSRVIWPGFLGDQRYVTAFYKMSDVLVLPSEYEPWALVINEAAAAGLAIVASDVVGAAAELVIDGENGRIFPTGDLDALAAALRDVTTEGTTQRMRSASRAVLERWRTAADPVQGLHKALLASRAIR